LPNAISFTLFPQHGTFIQASIATVNTELFKTENFAVSEKLQDVRYDN